jgi:hypothetical protein
MMRLMLVLVLPPSVNCMSASSFARDGGAGVCLALEAYAYTAFFRLAMVTAQISGCWCCFLDLGLAEVDFVGEGGAWRVRVRRRERERKRLTVREGAGMGNVLGSTVVMGGGVGRAAAGVGRWMKTEVYPRCVRSKSKSLAEGVDACVCVGVSMMCRNDADLGEREIEIDRLHEDVEGRRVSEGRRRGEWGEPGEPGWTRAAQVAMEEKVGERRAVGAGAWAGVGGRGWVGRFFWGGHARNA